MQTNILKLKEKAERRAEFNRLRECEMMPQWCPACSNRMNRRLAYVRGIKKIICKNCGYELKMKGGGR